VFPYSLQPLAFSLVCISYGANGAGKAILLANSSVMHFCLELKLQAQPTKAAQAAWEPGCDQASWDERDD
jgi:hypothetical protein